MSKRTLVMRELRSAELAKWHDHEHWRYCSRLCSFLLQPANFLYGFATAAAATVLQRVDVGAKVISTTTTVSARQRESYSLS